MNRTNQLFTRITALYICLLLTLGLFYCGWEGYQGITQAKFSMFCALSGGYVLLMVLLGLECALIGRLKLPSPAALFRRAGWTQRLMLAYLALTWLSALASPYWPKTVLGVSRFEGALSISIYVLSFLMVSAFGRAGARELAVFGGSALAFGWLCLLQLAGLNPFSLYPMGYGYQDAYKAYPGAYLGTVGNVGLVAALLCLAIPILWVGVARLRGKARLALLAPLSVLLLVLVGMWVLAGLVGVFGGGLLMAPVVLHMPPKRRKALAGAFLAGGLACLALLYLVDFKPTLLHQVHSILHGDWDGSFGSGRLYIWKHVLQIAPQRLWLGAGPDTMLLAGIEPFTRYDQGLGRTIVSQIDMAHNEYLNILFHQGALALAAYGAALGSAAWRWIKYSSADPVCAMLGGGVLCYCVQAFFGFSMCITAPFFWLALGLLENRMSKNEQEELLCGKN